MVHKFKKFLSAAILFASFAMTADNGNCSSCSVCPDTCAQGQNTWQPHAFSASFGREVLVTKHAWAPNTDEEGWHGMVGIAGEYQKSFNSCPTSCCSYIGSLPFWGVNRADNTPTYNNVMTVGNAVTTADEAGSKFDVDAYQIGMGPVSAEQSGTMTLKPCIYQAGADFYLYVGAHKTERGFFFKAHGPVGVMSVNPGFSFSGDLEAAAYPAGSLTSLTGSATPAPNETIGDAFMNPKSAGFLKAMNRGLISGKRTSSAKFGDPEFTLGYNVFADENKHLGLGVRFAAPTGNKADAFYMLEPIFGRNGHWAAGAELIGHWKCWESDNDDKYLNIMLDGDVMHLFGSKIQRSFDLKNNGAGSKYLLLARFDRPADGALFQNEILNAVNITTLGINSSFAVEGNFALVFDFHWKNWSMAIGYEGWGRSCEKICIDCSCPGSVDYNEYAVVGRQLQTYTTAPQTPLCQPAATMHNVLAASTTGIPNTAGTIVDATVSANRLSSNVADALDIEGQIARAVYTNKPFAQIQYTWTDSDYKPFLAISGGAEIPTGKNKKNSAVRFWNVGAQAGIAF